MLQASLRKPSARWQLYWADKDHLHVSLYCIQPFWQNLFALHGTTGPDSVHLKGSICAFEKIAIGGMRGEGQGLRAWLVSDAHHYLSRFIKGCLCCLLGHHFRPNSAPLWMGTTPLVLYKGCLPESRTGKAVWTVPIIAPLFSFIFKRQWKIRGSSYNPQSTNSISKNTNERLCATVI